MNNLATALLGLLTETSLHAGAGSAVGGVDLPIQREGHNGWPCVFGSAVKGALRDKAEGVLGKDNPDILGVFGPNTLNASDNAGAITVGDARLLLLPVRSLTGAFKWATCGEALERVKRDAKRLGLETGFDFDAPHVPADTVALSSAGSGDLYLEEYRFTLQADEKVAKCCAAIACLMERSEIEAELQRRLVIVSDDMFAHLTRTAVPVNAHIALDSATKTTRDGALWYEETLPPETLLYVPLAANKSRRQGHNLEAADVLAKVTDLFADKPYLQLGGNETVGMGWCAVKALQGV